MSRGSLKDPTHGKESAAVCGRYHVDEETAKEIEKIIQLTEENVRKRASINFSDAGKEISIRQK